jgi:DNA helicase-2/ATP-dependent DNA helicase PcrA
MEAEGRIENLLELVAQMREYEKEAEEPSLAGFLEKIALASDVDGYDPDKGAISLMTVHTAKGLEFPVVFIVGLEEGLLPHRRALEDERELEEERRLAYVGMTRAKDRLYLVHAHHRSTWGVGAASEASRFLAELPEELLAAERDEGTPFRRSWGSQGGWQRRGTDDDEWLPGGYRSPGRRLNETLRPVSLPDLAPTSVRPIGRELEAARQRVAGASYQAGTEIDLGSGTFASATAGAAAASPATPLEAAFRAGDHVRHRRFGEGVVVSSRVDKGDEWVTVAFVGQGVKELIAAYAGLERS